MRQNDDSLNDGIGLFRVRRRSFRAIWGLLPGVGTNSAAPQGCRFLTKRNIDYESLFCIFEALNPKSDTEL